MTSSLCDTCQHLREIVSGKGSRFLLCQLALRNPRYAKYPAQPVARCEGYVAQTASDPGDRESSDR